MVVRPCETDKAFEELDLECRNHLAFLPDKKILNSRIESQMGCIVAGTLWQAKNKSLAQRSPREIVLDDQGNSYSTVVWWPTNQNEPSYEVQLVNTIFVYGTLREGECRARLVSSLGGVKIAHGRVIGQLFDLGEYPGIVNLNAPDVSPGDGEQLTATDQLIRGEVYQFEDISTALQRLDQEEGFEGYGRTENLYSRVLCRIQTEINTGCLSWIYRYEGSVAGYQAIKSGDWLDRL